MGMVKAGSFASLLEAETFAHALDGHGIPFSIQGDNLGLPGSVIGSFYLLVPEDQVSEVWKILPCLAPPREFSEDYQ